MVLKKEWRNRWIRRRLFPGFLVSSVFLFEGGSREEDDGSIFDLFRDISPGV